MAETIADCWFKQVLKMASSTRIRIRQISFTSAPGASDFSISGLAGSLRSDDLRKG